MTTRLISVFFTAIIAVAVLTPINTVQAQKGEYTRTFILLTSESNNIEKLAQVQAFIKAGGGHVIHIFPHQALIARIRTNLRPRRAKRVERWRQPVQYGMVWSHNLRPRIQA